MYVCVDQLKNRNPKLECALNHFAIPPCKGRLCDIEPKYLFLKKFQGVGCLRALNKQMSLLNVCKLSFRPTAFLTRLLAVINLVRRSV